MDERRKNCAKGAEVVPKGKFGYGWRAVVGVPKEDPKRQNKIRGSIVWARRGRSGGALRPLAGLFETCAKTKNKNVVKAIRQSPRKATLGMRLYGTRVHVVFCCRGLTYRVILYNLSTQNLTDGKKLPSDFV